MRQFLSRPLRRLALPALAVCALSAGLPAGAVAAAPCANADRMPMELSPSARNVATLCLLNRERAAHRLRALRLDRRLGLAARRHSRDMIAHRYFAHDSRNGKRFSSRIAKTGWMRGRERCLVGENLAWGAGPRATPRAIVRAWMESPPHRRNILQLRFRVVGIAAVIGAPVRVAARAATYTTDFGA